LSRLLPHLPPPPQPGYAHVRSPDFLFVKVRPRDRSATIYLRRSSAKSSDSVTRSRLMFYMFDKAAAQRVSHPAGWSTLRRPATRSRLWVEVNPRVRSGHVFQQLRVGRVLTRLNAVFCRPNDQYTLPMPTRLHCRVASRRHRRCEHNSQLAHNDCRRIRSTIWILAKQTP